MHEDNGPDPNTTFPFVGLGYETDPKRCCFLKNAIKASNIEVGDYSYYDDPNGIESFERNVLYHYEFSEEKLIIGKFCALATGVQFIMGGAHHKIDGFSTFPFPLFKHGWEKAYDVRDFPVSSNTILGNDVWVGYGAMIMTGITIGDGAIIGARSLVTKNVEPYTIVGGNPAHPIRKRFDDATIRRLLEIRWWDWPIDKISRNLHIITGCDLEELEKVQ